jgi:3-oxoacyl-[acyl-carrier-protein] synthase-1
MLYSLNPLFLPHKKLLLPTPPPVFAVSSDVTSPLGDGTAACMDAILHKHTSVKQNNIGSYSDAPFMASMFNEAELQKITSSTNTALSAFEALAVYSCNKALNALPDFKSRADTLFILSTTKGNIESLGSVADESLTLFPSACKIAKNCGFTNRPMVVSNACTSGVAAILLAYRLLRQGTYKQVVITGCDRFTRFVYSGFQSFLAVSVDLCRPFDNDRKGINLGEAAATIVLSADCALPPIAQLVGGATTNDANHISGPSRTGAELALAIERTLQQASVSPNDIGMISTHGTATIYNDEMEANAFTLLGLQGVPTHSLKAYTGHTLGAAGVLECAIGLAFMQKQLLLPSLGYTTCGTTHPLNITTASESASIDYLLKTSSGFGGCNASLLWKHV